MAGLFAHGRRGQGRETNVRMNAFAMISRSAEAQYRALTDTQRERLALHPDVRYLDGAAVVPERTIPVWGVARTDGTLWLLTIKEG